MRWARLEIAIDRNQATDTAQKLLKQYGQSAFEIPLENAEDYEMMHKTFSDLGCATERDGESFVLRVLAR